MRAEFGQRDGSRCDEAHFLGFRLVVEQGSDDDACAEGHNNGEHSNAPSPSDAMYHTVDDEGRNPWHRNERKKRGADCQASPSCSRDVRDDDIVHDVRAGLTNGVKNESSSIRVEGLGGCNEDIREKVTRDGEKVRLSSTNDIGQFGNWWFDHSEDDGTCSSKS